MENAQVILVDENDREIGSCEKLEAHRRGLLHRAFSIFIYNSRGDMLLQQRAENKYHSPRLWTNACCSHPSGDVSLKEAATRRLKEEMGFTTELQKVFAFMYRTDFENGLTENEYDHVFTGEHNGLVNFNTEEVMDISWKDIKTIERELDLNPDQYSAWFRIAFPKLAGWWQERYGENAAK